MKQVRISKLTPLAIASLFLLGSVYCWYLPYTRGVFGTSKVEIPVDLEPGKSSTVRFAIREKGNHTIEIQFPKDTSDRLEKDLDDLSGKAFLVWDTEKIETDLSVNRQAWTNDTASIILFALPVKPWRQYTLSLKIDRIPRVLAGSKGRIRVVPDSNYYLIFWPIEWLGLTFFFVAMLCGIGPIRLQAWHRRDPFLVIIIISGAMILVGFIPRVVLSKSSGAWLSIMSPILIWIGPVILLLVTISWFTSSVIAYYGSWRRSAEEKGST